MPSNTAPVKSFSSSFSSFCISLGQGEEGGKERVRRERERGREGKQERVCDGTLEAGKEELPNQVFVLLYTACHDLVKI